MSRDESCKPPGRLVFEFAFEEPPEKLWRAISTPGLRESWLPDADLAETEPNIVTPGAALRYRMRGDGAEPESVVTFEVVANPAGGANLHVIHEWPEPRSGRSPANGNDPPLMRAA